MGKILETLVALISLKAALLAVGFFLYTDYLYQRPSLSDEDEKKILGEEMGSVLNFKTLKLDRLTTNLYSPGGRPRYLNVEAHLHPFEEEHLKRLEEMVPVVYDAILDLAGKKGPRELDSLGGKILFENEIRNKINEGIGENMVKRIFFSSFVIQ
ncbi:MAG: flagellar basal body-associated FliL family protein [Bacteriovoracales bacterium]|nr:flagellar basal body-associated FliL family protein [Bacteriovoracales bacterium]